MKETLNTIEIGNFRVSRADERNLQVDERRIVTAKPGRYVKEARETLKWVLRGYFPNVKSAATAILNYQVEGEIDRSEDLNSLVASIAKSEKAIIGAVKASGLELESFTR